MGAHRSWLQHSLIVAETALAVALLTSGGLLLQTLRHLQAVEGYADLGMYEEADAELRELDRAWLALEQTLSLQLRVYAGLNQCK